MSHILIIGGAGYIGSHVVKMLAERGYCPVVYDNLSKGHPEAVSGYPFERGDLGDKTKLQEVFRKYPLQAVMNFAACTDVAESVENPEKYFLNNTHKVSSLLESMVQAGIHYFVFSSSAAIFGNPKQEKLTEDHPQNPINPYGESKRQVEKMLAVFDRQYGIKSACLRYFNACGADDSAEIGESHSPETHLIPVILQTALGKQATVKIFGTDYPTPDGTCIRDYIHVNDLAKAHLLALEKLLQTQQSHAFNLGNGKGFSVKEIIEEIKKVTGRDFAVEKAAKRAGDPAVLVADYSLAKKELGWEPSYSLSQIIQTAWNWEKNRKF